MLRSRAPVRVNVRGGRWLLPWISLLLVSVGLAALVNSSLTGSEATGDAHRQEIAVTPVFSRMRPADALTEGADGGLPGRSCTELFGSYNWWLFDSAGHGPCRMETDAAPDPPSDR